MDTQRQQLFAACRIFSTSPEKFFQPLSTLLWNLGWTKKAQEYLSQREKEDDIEGRDVLRALVLDFEIEIPYKEDVRKMKQIRDDKLTISPSGAEKLDRWIEEKEKSRSKLRQMLREVKGKTVEKERGGEDDLMR